MITPESLQAALGLLLVPGTGVTLTPQGVTWIIGLTGGSTPPPVQDHNRYAAISETAAFTPADFTNGTSGQTDRLAIPTWNAPADSGDAGGRYVAFAVPDNTGDIVSIKPDGGFESISAFQRVPGTIQINNEAYKVWRSNVVFWVINSGKTYDLRQA